jgi:serine/threonine protein kinase
MGDLGPAVEAHGYLPIGCVGRGSQGAVYTVRHIAENATYVLKRMHIIEPDARRTGLLEAETLQRLHHPAIVGYRDTFVDDEYLCIVMEYADGGDLGTHIQRATSGGEAFTEEQILQWFVQLALALNHLHERGVLHRDLKTQNVFLSSSGHVKLGDFGIATRFDSTEQQAATCARAPWRPCGGAGGGGRAR